MIDRFCLAFFGGIDNMFEKLNKTVDDLWTFKFPNSKSKKYERHKKINRVYKK